MIRHGMNLFVHMNSILKLRMEWKRKEEQVDGIKN